MKKLALVAILLGVVSLPAFAQNKFIKEANTKFTATETSTPVQEAKGTQADQEKRAKEVEDAAVATDAAATGEAATEADAGTDEAARDTDAVTATDATGQEESDVEQ